MGIKSVVLMKPIVIIALPAYVHVSVLNSIKLYIWQELFIPPDTYTRSHISNMKLIFVA